MSNSKKPRLPKGRGIQKIDIPLPSEAPAPPVPPQAAAGHDTAIHVEFSDTDREILNDIRARLESQYGTPFDHSEVIRWAVWHSPWKVGATDAE